MIVFWDLGMLCLRLLRREPGRNRPGWTQLTPPTQRPRQNYRCSITVYGRRDGSLLLIKNKVYPRATVSTSRNISNSSSFTILVALLFPLKRFLSLKCNAITFRSRVSCSIICLLNTSTNNIILSCKYWTSVVCRFTKEGLLVHSLHRHVRRVQILPFGKKAYGFFYLSSTTKNDLRS